NWLNPVSLFNWIFAGNHSVSTFIRMNQICTAFDAESRNLSQDHGLERRLVFYAAQSNSSIEAEIAEKGRFRTKSRPRSEIN
ncbi:MAG: hypothetical protein ACSLFC_00295, partial [Desulfuromonadales bacterium]